MTGEPPAAFAGRDGGAPAGAPVIRVRLDELLSKRGMTLTELSARVDVTVVNLSILKNGRARAIRFSTLARLCEALRCQPGDLLGYEPPAPRAPGGELGQGSRSRAGQPAARPAGPAAAAAPAVVSGPGRPLAAWLKAGGKR